MQPTHTTNSEYMRLEDTVIEMVLRRVIIEDQLLQTKYAVYPNGFIPEIRRICSRRFRGKIFKLGIMT
jgi:hypothetical protein